MPTGLAPIRRVNIASYQVLRAQTVHKDSEAHPPLYIRSPFRSRLQQSTRIAPYWHFITPGTRHLRGASAPCPIYPPFDMTPAIMRRLIARCGGQRTRVLPASSVHGGVKEIKPIPILPGYWHTPQH